MELNEQQQKVAEAFEEFLQNDEQFFLCCSPAGTGKTFLTKHFITEIFPNYKDEYNNFYLTATTNRAASELFEATGIETYTIHSLLKLTLLNDYNTGETNLVPKGNVDAYELPTNSIVLVDECSMINKQLYNFLLTRTFNCKIIFIGDDKQLAPVKETLSPSFKTGVTNHRLTKVMRNNNVPELQELCSTLRDLVETKDFKTISVRGNAKVYTLEDKEEYRDLIKTHFAEPSLDKRILAYTNNTCINYCNYIFKNRGYTEYLNEGEYYTVNNVVKLRDEILFVGDTEVKLCEFLDEKNICGLDLITCELKYGKRHLTVNVPRDYNQYAQVLKFLAKQKDWRNYFKLKEEVADLRCRDASTVHKAQGMTLKEVFIDLDDLGTCKSHDTFARLLYVAVSRAREKVYMYGSLPRRFGKIVNI